MPPPPTSFLFCRSQAIFHASVVLDGLPDIDKTWIDQLSIHIDSPGKIMLDSWLGKGPTTHNLAPAVALYFDHGEQEYPVFGFPSESPRGAAVHVSSTNTSLTVDESGALFVLNVSLLNPVVLDGWDRQPDIQLNAAGNAAVQATLSETKRVLDTIVGAYALYQYPLIWSRAVERHSYLFIDTSVGAQTKGYQVLPSDNFIPSKLNASSRVTASQFGDGVTAHAASLVSAGLTEPLVFLKDSLWDEDLRTRFLLQFWMVEYFAEKHAPAMAPHDDARAFVAALQELVTERLPEQLERFKAKKGELLRRTLAEKVSACCAALRIQYDDPIFKRAKRVRDNLSHGSPYADSELAAMEQYIRELSRFLLRRELESRGIFLDGDPKPLADLPILEVPFVRALDQEKKIAPFQLI